MAHIIDIILFVLLAFSVAYVAFFAIVAAVCRNPHDGNAPKDERLMRFLVIFPSYGEDNVIVDSATSFLHQHYPRDKYQVTVVSDHQTPATNRRLSLLPLRLLTPVFAKSTKAQALQCAVSDAIAQGAAYDYAVILDADNIVEPDFLPRLNNSCLHGYRAIQCHRKAKNHDTDVAVVDGASEEINNTLFRLAHNRAHLSASLIGSGVCLDFRWLSLNVGRLHTAGEDREMEALLLAQHIYIRYEDDIYVYDEKVSDMGGFQRQRQRWVAAQARSLAAMLPHIPHAIATRNIDYIDKTIQQALIPRSMLIVMTVAIAVVVTLLSPLSAIKWWALLALLIIALFLALPKPMRSWRLLSKWTTALLMTLRMFRSATHIASDKGDFIHTSHHNSKEPQ